MQHPSTAADRACDLSPAGRGCHDRANRRTGGSQADHRGGRGRARCNVSARRNVSTRGK